MTDSTEPTVLDYLKSRLKFGKREAIPLFAEEEAPPAALTEEPPPEETPRERAPKPPFPWATIFALLFALVGQRGLEPPHTSVWKGLTFYLPALGLLILARLRGEWSLPSLPRRVWSEDRAPVRRDALWLGIGLSLAAFLLFGGNRFTTLNVTLWLAAVAALLWAFWSPRETESPSLQERLRDFLSRDRWQVSVTRWSLLLLAVGGVVLFFRLYHLGIVPAEPFSDHAEKLLDVYDVSQGKTRIFFPRNTGREAIQMYWTLLVAKVFGTGISYLSLKIGTALLGLLMLPYLYLLGVELGNRRVGLFALILAGISYWANVISRVGLRFPLYPLFVAPMLYYFLRGLRRGARNDFILAGIFLGAGMHGYSSFRITPFLVLAGAGMYLWAAREAKRRKQALLHVLLLTIFSIAVFLPLGRYMLENPMGFSYRALSRLTDMETPLPAPWWKVFLSNFWNSLAMFNWDNGGIWVHSIPGRPALGVVSGALFLIGIFLLLERFFRQRRWEDLFLLASIPILQLPSTLSLAYPAENPSLNRTAGAIVPVFLVVALALDGLWTTLKSTRRIRRSDALAWGVAGSLIFLAAFQNYHLVFHTYAEEYRAGTWNTSEMAEVIREFQTVYGDARRVWIVPYPYWVDTRLPGAWLGMPTLDCALWRENLPETLDEPSPKLFIVKPEDEETIDALRSLYPQGVLSRHVSDINEGHDFLMYFVP